MSSNSLIAKSVILVSALVGGVVGLFELSDRLKVTPQTEDVIVNDSGVGGALGETAVPDGQEPEADPTSGPVSDPAKGSPLERELALRVGEQLARFACTDVEVGRVTATATQVPDDETSHGFEGHTLEAAVVLEGAGGPERMRLVGSGKGPTGAVSAVDMALRGFGEQLTETGIFKENCKGV